MTSRTPPLLEPYLSGLPDEAALVVLTGILGASTNWLVLRYLHSFLKQTTSSTSTIPLPRRFRAALDDDEDVNDETRPQDTEEEERQQQQPSVLLVSFLRDYTFWKDSASRLGLDLDALARRGRFSFVDGLSSALFAPSSSPSTPSATTPPHTHAPIPDRGGRPTPAPTRGPLTATTKAPRPSQAQSQSLKRPLTNPTLAGVRSALHSAVDELVRARTRAGAGSGKVILVVDQLDFLLAATSSSAGAGVTSLGLRELLLDLREKVHATILTLSADEPLVVAQTTALEKEHASFVLSLAHEAETILSLRLLDTGVAKDVSGVLRITGGDGDRASRPVEEKEYLYQVVGDGGVRVFERGGQ
ncbi:hypothetical protein B0T22DRAFT_478184 [Podospora appendiculata]|uniref:Elongator complex protein 6 n=1 Tax=Podospora appendiculata TaxID=314037 RepID=A0AAE0XLA6_9PEZI|nr:hypothetical protein B0T22DRAFT_478184 [Podospora appendiculata]